MSMTFAEMKEKLQSRLKPSRFQHSLGVSETAVTLAKRFGVDEEKARIAGLLHDCARQYPNDELIAEAAIRGIAIGDVERETPLLLHADIGARLVAEEYGVEDEEIQQSIARHTVGGSNMSDLDKIVYFADMIEPNRDYPDVHRLRQLAAEGTLDEMVLAGLSQSIRFIVNQGKLLHLGTIIARNELVLKLKAARS